MADPIQEVLQAFAHGELVVVTDDEDREGEGDLIDHAKVAELIASGELAPNIATMGSSVLANIYGLRVIEDNLQDLGENYTSFLWVQRPGT